MDVAGGKAGEKNEVVDEESSIMRGIDKTITQSTDTLERNYPYETH